ncbi:MAG: Crp/Fnr family transcriptional regulator [Granulosicoccus sp.]
MFNAARRSAVADATIQQALQNPAFESCDSIAVDNEKYSSTEISQSIIDNCKSGDKVLSAGTTLYQEGEVCTKLYILLDGWVAACRNLKDGRQLILNFMLPGAFLGFQANLAAPMSNTVKCVTDVVVCVLPRTTFSSMLDDSPALAQSLNQSHANDEQTIMDNLINIATRPARARVANFLLDLHARVVDVYPRQSLANSYLPLTRQDIADTFGLTNVHVSRAICALQRENILSLKKKRLQIHDMEKLVDIASSSNR